MNKQLLDELDSYYNNYITNDSNCSLIQSDDDDDVNANTNTNAKETTDILSLPLVQKVVMAYEDELKTKKNR